ncbi:MAG: membrane protein insertion efficiency factor YidD [Clostridia bacterium]|nr:membrane protein insertion efficiency factor YidD [Clostridia bacterium]
MVKNFLLFLIKFYRKYLTYILKSRCIYTPSCSVYALEALKKRNLFDALLLIIWRIIRCNPLCQGGFDPVPDNPDLVKWVL